MPKPDFPVLGPHLWRVGQHLLSTEPRALAAHFRRPRTHATHATLGAPITPHQSNWIARRLSALNPAAPMPDALIIDTIFRAALLDHPSLTPPAGRRPHALLLAHDVFHRRHAALSLAGLSVRPAHLTRADEAALLNKASSIVAIQPDEAALITALCPERPVITVPMPATAVPRTTAQPRASANLVFLGSASLPNLDGLRWFLEQVWPRLRRQRPDLTLDLLGDCALALNPLPEAVYRHGIVPNLAPALHRASLAIAPLRAGSGLKIKLLEYARHGLVTIASPAALDGLAADPSSPFIAAATAADFSRAITANLANPPNDWRALSYITTHYGPAQIFAPLDALLTEIAAPL